MIIYDDVGPAPAKEVWDKIKAILDERPPKTSRTPRHNGPIVGIDPKGMVFDEIDHLPAPSQPRGGTSSKPGIPGHGGE